MYIEKKLFISSDLDHFGIEILRVMSCKFIIRPVKKHKNGLVAAERKPPLSDENDKT